MESIRFGTWIGAVAGLSVAMVCIADAKHKGRGQNEAVRREAAVLSTEAGELQRQVDSLRSDVQKAEQDYRAAQKARDAVKKELEKAETAAREAGRRLAEIAQRVEEMEPKDSPVGRARAASQAARAAYDAAVAKVEGAAEYQAAYQQAQAGTDRVIAIGALRKQWIDDDPAVAQTALAWRSARSAYETRRDTLLHKNAEWEAASKELVEARKTRDVAQRSPEATAAVQREGIARKQLAKLQVALKAKMELLARVQSTERQLPQRAGKKADRARVRK